LSADVHYTTSVGQGSDAVGYLKLHKTSGIKYSSRFIVVADGLYMGRQSVGGSATRTAASAIDTPARPSRRAARRQNLGMANVAFADGHVEAIAGDQWPRTYAAADSAALTAQKKGENVSGYSIYANPEQVFP